MKIRARKISPKIFLARYDRSIAFYPPIRPIKIQHATRRYQLQLHFLLLARYVPNVAKRSKKKYILRTDRPTDDRRPTDLSFGQYWGYFKWPYLREGSSDPLRVWLYHGGVFEVGGSNGAISGFAKFITYVALGKNNARGVIRLVTI